MSVLLEYFVIDVLDKAQLGFCFSWAFVSVGLLFEHLCDSTGIPIEILTYVPAP